MKKAVLLVCVAALAVACGTTKKSTFEVVDERNVPDKFVKDFKRQKPGIDQVKWEKIDSLTYRANFISNGNISRMQFTNASVLSSWVIPLEYCEAIKTYVAENYKGFKVEEVLLSDKDKVTKSYLVTISQKKVTKELEFDLMQAFVKEVAGKETK